MAIFDAEDSRLLAAMDRIDRRLRETQERFAAFGEGVSHVLALAGVSFAVEKAIEGVKEALDFGKEMHDVSAETGLAVKDVTALREEFENAGRDGSDVGDVMAKMMRNIDTGAANHALAALRLNLSELRTMGTAEQFVAIGRAINGLETPMARVAAASAIFEKHAGTLLPMFGAAHFGQAAEEIGREAEVLDENAGLFADTANELRIAGEKTRGFYVGFSAEIAPMLHDVLAAINEKDATGAGEDVGGAIAGFMESFSNGNYGEVIGLSIISGLDTALEYIFGSIGTIDGAIAGALVGAAEKFGLKLMDEGYKLLDLLAKIPGLHGLEGAHRELHKILSPGEHRSVGKQAEEWGEDIGRFIGKRARGPWDGAVSRELNRVSDKDAMDALERQKRDLAATKGQQNRTGPLDFNQTQPETSELGRIGGAVGQFYGINASLITGAGAVDPMQAEAQRQTAELRRHTALLTQLVEHGKKPGAKTAHPGVYR